MEAIIVVISALTFLIAWLQTRERLARAYVLAYAGRRHRPQRPVGPTMR